MTPILKILAGSALLGATALAGCATTEATAAATSELTGSLQQSSFPAVVTSITVARDDGTKAVTPVSADGTFSALLEKGGTYRLLLSADGLGTPVVLDSSDGRLRTTIEVTSAGGAVDIGSVVYWDPAAGGVSSKTQALDTSTTVTAADTGCVDGVIAGTRQACATTEAPVDCTAANDMSHGCVNMDDDASTTTPATPVSTDGTATDADATLPMALPAQNAPAQIACAAVAGGHGHRHGH